MDFFVAFLWRWSSWSSRSLLRQALAVFHRTSGNLWDNLWDTLWAVWTTGVTQESERVMHSNAEICTTFLLELSQLHRSHEIYCFTWKTILVKVRVVSGQAMLPLKLDHWFSDKLPFHGLLHSLTISSKRCHAALLSTFIVPSLWPERVLCQWRLSPWLIYSGMIWLELCNTLHYFAACHALSDFLIISNLGTCDLITWGRATLLRLHAVCNPAGWTSPGSTVKCGAGNDAPKQPAVLIWTTVLGWRESPPYHVAGIFKPQTKQRPRLSSLSEYSTSEPKSCSTNCESKLCVWTHPKKYWIWPFWGEAQ